MLQRRPDFFKDCIVKGASTSNAAALLNRIESLLKEVDKKEPPVTSKPMAEILGMTWENLRKTYILASPDFPIHEHGGQGRNYLFDVRSVLLWMQAHLKEKLRKEVDEAQRIARLTGVAVADDAAPIAGLADLSALLRIARDVEDMKQRQGQIIPRATVDAFISAYHGIFMSEILASAGTADPTGQWPIEIRAQWQEQMKSLAMKLQKRVDEEISQPDANISAIPPNLAARSGGAGTRGIRRKPIRDNSTASA